MSSGAGAPATPRPAQGRGVEGAATLDDVARATVSAALSLPGVVRVGLAVVDGGGRELLFVASGAGAVTDDDVAWCRIDGLADVPLAQTVRTGLPVRLADTGVLGQRYPHLLDRQVSLGVGALAAYPLFLAPEAPGSSTGGAGQLADRVLGGLLLGFGASQRFDADQDGALTALAEQAAVALAGARDRRRPRQDRRPGRGPSAAPEAEGVELGYLHAEHPDSHGDGWAELVDLPDGALLVAVGRAPSGDGAVDPVLLRAAVRDHRSGADPALVLEGLDRLARTDGPRLDAAVVVLDPGRTLVRIAVAGDVAVVACCPPRRAHRLGVDAGPPLGSATGPRRFTTAELSPGELLVLASDAPRGDADEILLDEPSTEHLGPDEVCAALGSGWQAGRTLVAVRVLAGTPVRSASLTLEAGRTAPRIARAFARGQLQEWSAGHLGDNAAAAVSELVTNAVIHAGTAMRLTLRLDERRLLATVRDEGQGEPFVAGGLVDAVGGRGLMIVAGLCQTWGSRRGPEGTAVWFSLAAGHPRPEPGSGSGTHPSAVLRGPLLPDAGTFGP